MIENNKPSGNVEISTFHIGDAVLGITILDVQEINKEFEITKVPKSSDHIEGVMNLRGRIVTVLNTEKILGLPNARNDKGNRIIIVDSKGEYIGLIADIIGDVVLADDSDIEAPPVKYWKHQRKIFSRCSKKQRATYWYSGYR
jgi:purine-binding chemotaxis protein CheW